MGAYRPSSLIDFLASRPVEVEAIWGNPLQAGEGARHTYASNSKSSTLN